MPRHPPPLNPAENGLLGGSGSTGKVARGSGSATTDWIALPLVWIEALVLLAEATLASAVAAKARDAALALAPSPFAFLPLVSQRYPTWVPNLAYGGSRRAGEGRALPWPSGAIHPYPGGDRAVRQVREAGR